MFVCVCCSLGHARIMCDRPVDCPRVFAWGGSRDKGGATFLALNIFVFLRVSATCEWQCVNVGMLTRWRGLLVPMATLSEVLLFGTFRLTSVEIFPCWSMCLARVPCVHCLLFFICSRSRYAQLGHSGKCVRSNRCFGGFPSLQLLGPVDEAFFPSWDMMDS